MKRLLLICSILFAFAINFAAAQLPANQKIVMKINGITVATGEEVKALDFRVEALTSYTTGSGAAVGKPNPSPVIIKKDVGKSTSDLLKKITQGSNYPEVIFDYVDDKGTSSYTITLTNAFVTELFWLTPECPTCLKLEHQVSFVFKTIKIQDKVNGTIFTWDVSTMVSG